MMILSRQKSYGVKRFPASLIDRKTTGGQSFASPRRKLASRVLKACTRCLRTLYNNTTNNNSTLNLIVICTRLTYETLIISWSVKWSCAYISSIDHESVQKNLFENCGWCKLTAPRLSQTDCPESVERSPELHIFLGCGTKQYHVDWLVLVCDSFLDCLHSWFHKERLYFHLFQTLVLHTFH